MSKLSGPGEISIPMRYRESSGASELSACETDCIIVASGFDLSHDLCIRSGFEIYGRDGLQLMDYYSNARRTLHGHSSCGYPDWFYLGGGQNALSANVTAMFDDQAKHVAYIIREVRSRGATVVEPPKEAEQA